MRSCWFDRRQRLAGIERYRGARRRRLSGQRPEAVRQRLTERRRASDVRAVRDPEEGWRVLHFPVPFAAPDVSLADDWRTLGMRATGSHSVVLDQVFVAADAIVLRRPRGRFHPAWNVILTVALPLIMSVYAGVAETAAAIGLISARQRGTIRRLSIFSANWPII